MYEIKESKLIYEGPVFSAYSDKVLMPDGSVAKREYIERGGAAAIVPVDPDGNIVFVSQYRHPFKKILLEIPAGMLEPGETPEVCARRELEEETGFISDDIAFLAEAYPAVGVCSEIIYYFMAWNLKKGKQNFDPDEFIELETHSLKEALDMIFSGEIKDGKTITGILMYNELLKKAN
ncbi:MAG: NUDIX hydrolase [Lachnospiraceae bacterium]|nr:NUDIX hydrolase [Lachnospiraceae bacterium]